MPTTDPPPSPPPSPPSGPPSGSATIVRYGVLAGLCGAASIAYLCRNSIGVAESTIRSELQLSESAMGWVMSSFFLAYALLQVPAGWLGTRWGSRLAIPACAVGWSLATALLGLATGFSLLLTARLANGVAQAGLFPACTATIGHWFPHTRRAVANGCLASSMSLGGAIGVAITGLLVVQWGWRTTFLVYSSIGMVFAALFYWGFRDTPSEHPWVGVAERTLIAGGRGRPVGGSSHDAWRIFLRAATWWICGQQFCRAAGEIFFSSWFATYLQETRGVSVVHSGLLNSLPLGSIVAGGLIGGSLSDLILVRSGNRYLARSALAAGSMLLCSLFVFAAYFIAEPLPAVLVISLGIFCAAIGGPCAYTVTIDMGGRHTAVLFATMNMVGNLGAFAFIRLVPELIEYTSWSVVLALFGALYLAAAVCWLLIQPGSSILGDSLD